MNRKQIKLRSCDDDVNFLLILMVCNISAPVNYSILFTDDVNVKNVCMYLSFWS